MAATADVCVIGAGPAGLTAATVAARAGLQAIVLDESLEAGGRVQGQLHRAHGHGENGWWRGPEVARQLGEAALAAGVAIYTRTAAWGIWPGFTVVAQGSGPAEVRAAHLLLATGAAEGALPMPGWTLPGVISIGAAQVLVNVHRIRPGRRVLVVGIDPLGVSIAASLALAGVEVIGVVNPPPGELTGNRGIPAENLVALSGAAKAAGPSMGLRLAGGLVSNRTVAALALRVLPRGTVKVWDVPVQFGTAALELVGDDRVREAVLAPVSPDGEISEAKASRVPVDAVCLAAGLTPQAELALTAGCAFTVVPELGGQVPLQGTEQETTVANLYVAGSLGGVESAESAIEQGRIAGTAIARDAGRLDPRTAEKEIAAARERLETIRSTTGSMINPSLVAGRAVLAQRWVERAQTGARIGSGGNR